jgi:hypothetical protein
MEEFFFFIDWSALNQRHVSTFIPATMQCRAHETHTFNIEQEPRLYVGRSQGHGATSLESMTINNCRYRLAFAATEEISNQLI